ncbi:MAG: DUF547 domain-containing protein [Rhodopseudomonas palustris]|nr:DUF547 domain-containing protein [Rhodopseudomonas palustris]
MRRVSLDDIEHEPDSRLGPLPASRASHFAVNCASVGCPALRRGGLRRRAAGRTARGRDPAVRRRSHPQPRAPVASSLQVSSIFEWYRRGFRDRLARCAQSRRVPRAVRRCAGTRRRRNAADWCAGRA